MEEKMPTSYIDVDVKCPFYKYLRNRGVFCDLEKVENIEFVTLSFETKKKCEEYMRQRCCEEYRECQIYRILMKEKYPDFKE